MTVSCKKIRTAVTKISNTYKLLINTVSAGDIWNKNDYDNQK